jgi:hypothetical protein
MNLDLSSTIETFAMDVTCRRPAPPTVTNGRPTAGAQTSFTVRALVRPIPGEELRQMPEGERSDAGIRAWVLTALRTTRVLEPADLIEWEGEDWKVTRVEAAQPQGRYWRVDAMRLGQ